MKNKIILGSANFNQIYGIKKNFIKKKEIKKSFNLALKNNIRMIDTSPLYNKSFHRSTQPLGKFTEVE